MGYYETTHAGECECSSDPTTLFELRRARTALVLRSQAARAGEVVYPLAASRTPGRRFLQVQTGRWLSRDPIAEQGGLNLYGFVSGTPIFRVDALGLDDGHVVVDQARGEWGEQQDNWTVFGNELYRTKYRLATWTGNVWGEERQSGGDLFSLKWSEEHCTCVKRTKKMFIRTKHEVTRQEAQMEVQMRSGVTLHLVHALHAVEGLHATVALYGVLSGGALGVFALEVGGSALVLAAGQTQYGGGWSPSEIVYDQGEWNSPTELNARGGTLRIENGNWRRIQYPKSECERKMTEMDDITNRRIKELGESGYVQTP